MPLKYIVDILGENEIEVDDKTSFYIYGTESNNDEIHLSAIQKRLKDQLDKEPFTGLEKVPFIDEQYNERFLAFLISEYGSNITLDFPMAIPKEKLLNALNLQNINALPLMDFKNPSVTQANMQSQDDTDQFQEDEYIETDSEEDNYYAEQQIYNDTWIKVTKAYYIATGNSDEIYLKNLNDFNNLMKEKYIKHQPYTEDKRVDVLMKYMGVFELLTELNNKNEFNKIANLETEIEIDDPQIEAFSNVYAWVALNSELEISNQDKEICEKTISSYKESIPSMLRDALEDKFKIITDKFKQENLAQLLQSEQGNPPQPFQSMQDNISNDASSGYSNS
ncbi:hypothetical protein L3V83_05480 [Thiotrichales bacterium 19X7-9]|nr:hypothetical protein [Thiotrichales bacterium 19X7-9]